MFQGCFEEVLRVLQGRLIEGDSRELKGYLKEVQRDQLSIPLPYPFQRFKEVWRVFQENFNQNFKVVSRVFYEVLFCMNLIAATRAEGGLVLVKNKDNQLNIKAPL